MSGSRRHARRSLRPHLSYANVMATVAVFAALGGGAYAATELPRGSVGSEQLRERAVTRSKLANRSVSTRKIVRHSVSLSRLSNRVRARLGRRAAPGRRGPRGKTGPRGPAGIDALGARRVRFDAAAEGAPASTVLDMPGFQLQATCTPVGADVVLGLRARAAEDAVLQASFNVDTGSDPQAPQSTDSGNIQIPLTGGAYTDFGGPGTQNGTGYFRVNARAIVDAPSGIISLNLYELVVAGAPGHCRIGGTAVPSS